MQTYLTYEQFGAVGDGLTDDMPAIVRTHAEANRLGLPVRARDHALYRIANRSATAEIGTDTDWGDASFVIDDRGLDRCDAPVFHVKSLTVTEPPDRRTSTIRRGKSCFCASGTKSTAIISDMAATGTTDARGSTV